MNDPKANKMTSDTPVLVEGWSDEKMRLSPIIEHVLRTIDDAEALERRGSYGRAFALGLLAFEEIGKAALSTWEAVGELPRAPKGQTAHIRKQRAASALCLGREVCASYFAGRESGLDPISSIGNVIAAFRENNELEFASRIPAHSADKMKQAGFYYDEPSEAGTNTAAKAPDAEAMIQRAGVALMMLKDGLAMTFARATFVETNDIALDPRKSASADRSQ